MSAANDNGLGVPPGVYDMVQAAAFLKVGRRAVQDRIKIYPYYSVNGRRKLFSKANIDALWETMQCHSSTTSLLGERTGTYEESTTLESMFSGHSKPKTKKQQKR